MSYPSKEFDNLMVSQEFLNGWINGTLNICNRCHNIVESNDHDYHCGSKCKRCIHAETCPNRYAFKRAHEFMDKLINEKLDEIEMKERFRQYEMKFPWRPPIQSSSSPFDPKPV